MTLRWPWSRARRHARALARDAARAWELRVGDAALATLRHPRLDDMFWISLEIVPLTTPPDPRLDDDDFWWGDAWTLVEHGTGRVARCAIASASGLRRAQQRVVIRGLDAG